MKKVGEFLIRMLILGYTHSTKSKEVTSKSTQTHNQNQYLNVGLVNQNVIVCIHFTKLKLINPTKPGWVDEKNSQILISFLTITPTKANNNFLQAQSKHSTDKTIINSPCINLLSMQTSLFLIT